MNMQTKTPSSSINKQYSIAIDTLLLPDNPEERIRLVIDQIAPVNNLIMTDAMTVAIGTWPTPEKPRKS